MELELKHLTGYLPYGLKFVSELDKPYDEYGKQPIWTCNGITFLFGDNCLNNIETNDAYPMHLCKLILRPLSDLTKEIEVNGEKFVPLEVLGKIYEPNGTFEDDVFGWDCATGGDDYQDYYYVIHKDLTYAIVCGNPNDSYCYATEIGNLHYDIIQQLLEWHFDIYGLIENNLAIDINTL